MKVGISKGMNMKWSLDMSSNQQNLTIGSIGLKSDYRVVKISLTTGLGSYPELGSSTAQLFLTLPKLNGLSNIKGPKTSRFPFSYLLLFHTRSPIFLARKEKTSSFLLGIGTSYFTFSVSLG